MKARNLAKVRKIAEYLDDLKEKLIAVRDDEQDHLDNLGENDLDSDAADSLSHAIETLEAAADELGEVANKLNSIADEDDD